MPRPRLPGESHVTSPVHPTDGAIVFGGNYRALGIVRSLGRHHIPIWVLTDEHQLARYSRYASRSAELPREQERQIEFLHNLSERHALGGWTVFPSSDEDATLLARHHAALSQRFCLAAPDWNTFQWAYDKRLTHQLAHDAGIPHPLTYYPRSRDEAAALALEFPVILKPAIKEGFNAFIHAKAWQANTREQFLARYNAAAAMLPPENIMVQELIPGGGETQFSYAALCRDGHPLVSIVARRTRQYPMDFGRLSTYVESVNAPEVEQAARTLIAALAYTGVIELEFKCDPRTDAYKLLDINMRAWGWHTLGRRLGADFPYLYWELLHGEPVAETRVPPGARWARLTVDLLAAAPEILHGRLRLGAFLRSFRPPIEWAVMSTNDPLPGVLEVMLLMQVALRRKAL